jgi:hypothetical protein
MWMTANVFTDNLSDCANTEERISKSISPLLPLSQRNDPVCHISLHTMLTGVTDALQLLEDTSSLFRKHDVCEDMVAAWRTGTK